MTVFGEWGAEGGVWVHEGGNDRTLEKTAQ